MSLSPHEKKPNRILILCIFLLPFFIFLVSDSSATPLDDSSLQDVIDAGKIVVGIEACYPPFEQRNLVTDEIEGFDPDIMQYIADDIGVSIEWVDISWAVIFNNLQAGLFDCVISAITITSEREESMDFSRWYYRVSSVIMVNEDNPNGIETIEDMNSTSVTVGVQAGTTGEMYFNNDGFVAVKISYATISLAVEALKLGIIDVVIGGFAELSEIKEEESELLYIKDVFQEIRFGIPVQTGSDTLRLRINSIIDELLGENSIYPTPIPYYTTSHKEWFGTKPYINFYGEITHYKIDATCSNNGTINPIGEISVAEGDDKFFNFIPDDGFLVDHVSIDGTNIGTSNNYTFTNVNSDHTLRVEFIKESIFDIPGYSIILFIVISSAAVSIITVKIQKRKLK